MGEKRRAREKKKKERRERERVRTVCLYLSASKAITPIILAGYRGGHFATFKIITCRIRMTSSKVSDRQTETCCKFSWSANYTNLLRGSTINWKQRTVIAYIPSCKKQIPSKMRRQIRSRFGRTPNMSMETPMSIIAARLQAETSNQKMNRYNDCSLGENPSYYQWTALLANT